MTAPRHASACRSHRRMRYAAVRASAVVSLFFASALGPRAADSTPAPRPPSTPSAPATTPASALASSPPPAINWVLPIFTDKEGYRSMTLRGSEVRPNKTSVAVTDLSITIFSGDAAAKVDSILLSAEAQFFPKDQRASGEKAVRYIRDDIEVTGQGWTYDHATKRVTLQRNVRVTFASQINDILK